MSLVSSVEENPGGNAGLGAQQREGHGVSQRQGLYTAEERQRRDASRWTFVQGVLAPLQLLAFMVSVALVIRYLLTDAGLLAANVSVVVKTTFLYAIMITGCLWERDVYGCYLFARPFFWEDVVSMVVMALHTAYLVALFTGALASRELMLLALAAYATYLINALQFLWKFRMARREKPTGTVAAGDRLALAE